MCKLSLANFCRIPRPLLFNFLLPCFSLLFWGDANFSISFLLFHIFFHSLSFYHFQKINSSNYSIIKLKDLIKLSNSLVNYEFFICEESLKDLEVFFCGRCILYIDHNPASWFSSLPSVNLSMVNGLTTARRRGI